MNKVLGKDGDEDDVGVDAGWPKHQTDPYNSRKHFLSWSLLTPLPLEA